MTDTNIALIGSGPISHFHVPALEAHGMNVGAVASMNPDSETVDEFADEFGIQRAYRGEDWRTMVEDDRWDGVVIATHVDGTPEALRHTLATGVPVLVEKPVAWRSAEIRSLRREAHDDVIVGYNRRYYRTTEEAREFLTEHRPVMATAELPAASDIASFLSMSTHGLDLLRYLFGELSVLDTHELVEDDELRGYTATLRSPAGDVVNVIGNWDAPSNIGIDLDYHDLRFQVEPYERARKFHGFDILEPTEEVPIRRYVPKETDQIELAPEDAEYKPGFYQQAERFRRLIEDEPAPDDAATLGDAEEAIRLGEQLLPERLPDDAP